jgi:formiminotetrahydrofolate cyclodeaminase
VHDQPIGQFLDQLAAKVPAPGGGAVAALQAAQSAALLAMVARYSDGEQYAEHEPVITRVRQAADAAREQALELAETDAVAFGAVAEAYRLPRQTPAEQAARSAAIAAALAGAAKPPAAIAALAGRLVALAEQTAAGGQPERTAGCGRRRRGGPRRRDHGQGEC